MGLDISNSKDTLDTRDILEYMDSLDSEDEEDIKEHILLSQLIDTVRDVSNESPENGCLLINDHYFEEYAMGFADDIGAINRDAHWPLNCIDWERAARMLQMDYTSVDYDGVTYWVR